MSSLKYARARAGAVEEPRSAHEAALLWTTIGLRSASVALARLARRFARPAGRFDRPAPQLEFYAEAGAPEGALYFDGKLVGWVSGVQRL